MAHQLLILWLRPEPPVMQPITDTASYTSGGRLSDGQTDSHHHPNIFRGSFFMQFMGLLGGFSPLFPVTFVSL